MQAIRKARLESAIQEELSEFIPHSIKDPRVPSLTITQVSVTQDASHATVFIAILGGSSAEEMQNCLKGLTSASGFLRKHLAQILKIRHVPALNFREDKGIENVSRVHELLKKISSEGKPTS